MPGETEARLGKLRHEGLRSSLPTLLPALALWGLALGSILCCSMAGVPPGLSRFPRHPLVSPGLWGCPFLLRVSLRPGFPQGR